MLPCRVRTHHKAKSKEARPDLSVCLGNTLWEESRQHPEGPTSCKPGGAAWAPSGHAALEGVCRPRGSLGLSPGVQAEARG